MNEHPTDQRLEQLRHAGWTIVSTLNGIRAHRDGRTISSREALELDDNKQEAQR
jgi:hypothetical protein